MPCINPPLRKQTRLFSLNVQQIITPRYKFPLSATPPVSEEKSADVSVDACPMPPAPGGIFIKPSQPDAFSTIGGNVTGASYRVREQCEVRGRDHPGCPRTRTAPGGGVPRGAVSLLVTVTQLTDCTLTTACILHSVHDSRIYHVTKSKLHDNILSQSQHYPP